MERDKAEFRRAMRQPSYTSIERKEYLVRAHEFASRGEKLATKLTEAKVIEIRENREGITDKKRAEKLGISASMVFSVRNRIRWGHV